MKDLHTELHDAAMEGNTRIVLLLLEQGADPPLAKNEYGRTPLHLAARNV